MLSGSLQTKPNTGDQFYRVLMMNYRYVIASVSKNDGSGDNLTVNVYQDGTLITTDSTSIPYGNLDVVAPIAASGSGSPVGNSTENVTVPEATLNGP